MDYKRRLPLVENSLHKFKLKQPGPTTAKYWPELTNFKLRLAVVMILIISNDVRQWQGV